MKMGATPAWPARPALIRDVMLVWSVEGLMFCVWMIRVVPQAPPGAAYGNILLGLDDEARWSNPG